MREGCAEGKGGGNNLIEILCCSPQIPVEWMKTVDALFQQCTLGRDLNDQELTDSLCMHLERVLGSIEDAFQVVHGISAYESDVVTLRELQMRARTHHRALVSSVSTCSVVPQASLSLCQACYTGNSGRPQLHVNIEQVELLRSSNFTWEEIAQIVGVGRTTLWRKLRKLGMPIERYSDINDSHLDQLLREIQLNNPNIGVSMLQGHLKSLGKKIQWQRIRESILRINPLRAIIRWQQSISRRSYWVPGPNSLWHIDGHHSLIRWRFVIHGCVDGYSRLITYLFCSTNNRAATVLDLFRKATAKFGTPSRVRSDRGGENVFVCHYMVSLRGPGRGSHIAGSSVHNQRVERMWRDVYRCVCCSFHEIFYLLEAQELLNPDSELDLFILHTVFLRVINHHLNVFVNAWNHHPLRTERNWSPRKIWINGMIDPERRDQTAVKDAIDGFIPQNIEEFGVDNGGPFPDEQFNTVDVPETVCPIPDATMELFVQGDSVNIEDAVKEYTAKRLWFISYISNDNV